MLAEEGSGLMQKRHATRAVSFVAFPAGPATLRPHCERSRATCPSRFASNLWNLISAQSKQKRCLRARSMRQLTARDLRFAPEAQIDDGLLDVVLIEDLSTFEVLALLPRLIFSGEPRRSRVRRWRARRVRLTTRKPTLFHGDGEILGPTPVEIEVVPRAVQVLAPART